MDKYLCIPDQRGLQSEFQTRNTQRNPVRKKRKEGGEGKRVGRGGEREGGGRGREENLSIQL